MTDNPQMLCGTCGTRVAENAHFCGTCSKILSLPDRVNFFEFMELPLQLNLDTEQLQQNFFRLSREFHPDYYTNRPPSEQEAALQRSATLNLAYNTLKDPIQRIEYVLRLFDYRPEAPKNQVPSDLVAEIFEVQEHLEEFLSADDTEADGVRTLLQADLEDLNQLRHDLHEGLKILCQRFDEAAGDDRLDIMTELRENLDKLSYLRRIIENIQTTLGSRS